MCTAGYTSPNGNGTGFIAALKDRVSKGKTAGGGVGTGGYSGPSAAASAGTAYMRRKAGAPLLDSMFGVDQQNG